MSPILRGVVVALFFSLVLGCKKEVPSPALGELVAAEKAFAQMGADKGIREAFLAFFADDGISFEPHPVKTKESLSKRPAPTGPRTLLVEWEPTYADVSRSGELGYTTGPSVLTDLSPQKKAPQYGTYFSIWRKQADGAWKVLLDLGTDGPGGPPAEPRAFRAAPPSGWAAGSGTTNLESRGHAIPRSRGRGGGRTQS